MLTIGTVKKNPITGDGHSSSHDHDRTIDGRVRQKYKQSTRTGQGGVFDPVRESTAGTGFWDQSEARAISQEQALAASIHSPIKSAGKGRNPITGRGVTALDEEAYDLDGVRRDRHQRNAENARKVRDGRLFLNSTARR